MKIIKITYFCLFWAQLFIVASIASDSMSNTLKSYLIANHKDLLIEKGYLDHRGVEIEWRLKKLVQQKKHLKYLNALNEIFAELNYVPENILKMPHAAFDRPLGFKMKNYAHCKHPGMLKGSEEGNACPVGGFGAGAFERSISGNFRYWFLDQGNMVDDIVWANQFHIFVKAQDKTFAQTLSNDHPPFPDLLSAWDWDMEPGKGKYYALYPKSGYDYSELPDIPLEVGVVQFSPVWPNNYYESSWPVAIYKWIVKNRNQYTVECSIMLTWENMVGWETVPQNPNGNQRDRTWSRQSVDQYNQYEQSNDIHAIVFRKKRERFESRTDFWGEMCIAVQEPTPKAAVTYSTKLNTTGDGNEVWYCFSENGQLTSESKVYFSEKNESNGAALAVKIKLAPNEQAIIPFAISWDFPFMEFASAACYRKKYTQFFNSSGTNALNIAEQSLSQYVEWEHTIDNWQSRILEDASIPIWLKQMLFNELYILPETGIWNADLDLFTCLESFDYPNYGTFDVESYSSWNLLTLWPKLELDNMKYVTNTVDWSDPVYQQYQYQIATPNLVPPDKSCYYWNTVKEPGMVIHDLGSPHGYPWIRVNGFDQQNSNVRKDLNPTLPLRAYRDYVFTGRKNDDFLIATTTASIEALLTLASRFSDEESFIPKNEGIPDQIYDSWLMKGNSSFIGILWLAALKTTTQMIEELQLMGFEYLDDYDLDEVKLKFLLWFELGRNALKSLWNPGKGYYHIDAFNDDIMTDQLYGLWNTKICGLEKDTSMHIFPEKNAIKTLLTIYSKCVKGFANGYYGAVNGRTTHGNQLNTVQGDEVWPGTTFAFASNCILHGLINEGLHAAYGSYQIIYSPFGHGYYFKTPAAYVSPGEVNATDPTKKYGDNLFRAQKQMRAGSIWSVYEALKQVEGSHEKY